ncbi:START domain-containing protein [Dyadobacter luticola]|uniref:Lipid-binding protein n=1 Tax=Dyadobacter luticola TaxID=1979387 RepID=A0A5R9L0S8_9BACT|nr:START domain-containing protein [Dyadobacter luticola]TLV02156.1 lipid-binding protein [Dyadobacter luticola]
MKKFLFVILIFTQIGTALGQSGGRPSPGEPYLGEPSPGRPSQWKLVAEKGDIKVYNRLVPGSKVKALKAECVLNARVEEVVDLLLDIPAATKWVCHAKSCTILRKVSDREVFYYTEVSLPWPLDNRDFVTNLTISENPLTKVVTVEAPAVPGFLPEKKGLVRIKKSVSTWTITPVATEKVKVEYTLQVDPGGAIPAHIVNLFACQGPIETFTNMKKELQLRQAKSAEKDFGSLLSGTAAKF